LNFAGPTKDKDHIVLDEAGFQIVIHGIPKKIAETIEIRNPPDIREETPIKICLPVSSIESALQKPGNPHER
jgi:hypothetical protein